MRFAMPIASLLAAFAAATVSTALPIWINEIHYDNAGTDSGEFVEVAGVAGTDLTGYFLHFYNGSSGSVYDTEILAGIVPNEDLSGFGAIAFFVSGIQNGSPDGIALSGPEGLLEFLSYEGQMTASGGPADGILSTDIGVNEPDTTPTGQSLQRTGSYPDGFIWTGPLSSTPQILNLNQTFPTVGSNTNDAKSPVSDEGSTALLLLLAITTLRIVRRKGPLV